VRSRSFQILVVVLIVGALLQGLVIPILGLSVGEFWAGLFAIGLVLGAVLRPAGVARPTGEFLCDSCRYNDARYCSLPERPNATRCEDFRTRPGED
jgi:hypothetical protein